MNTPPSFPQQPGGPTPPTARPKNAPQVDAPGDGDGKAVPTQRATRTWFLFGAVALLVALVAFVLAQPKSEKVETAHVVVTARSLQALTPVKASDFTTKVIPLELVESKALTAETAEEALAKLDIDGKDVHVRYPLPGGSQLRPSYLSYESQLPAGSGELAPDERLVTVEASIATSVGGVLRVGDKVELYAVNSLNASGYAPVSDFVTVRVLSDVEIVAINLRSQLVESIAGNQIGQTEEGGAASAPEDYLPGEPLPGMYTLKVKSDAVERVILANEGSKLYIAYHGTDAEITEWAPTRLTDVFCSQPDSEIEGRRRPQTPDFCVGL